MHGLCRETRAGKPGPQRCAGRSAADAGSLRPGGLPPPSRSRRRHRVGAATELVPESVRLTNGGPAIRAACRGGSVAAWPPLLQRSGRCWRRRSICSPEAKPEGAGLGAMLPPGMRFVRSRDLGALQPPKRPPSSARWKFFRADVTTAVPGAPVPKTFETPGVQVTVAFVSDLGVERGCRRPVATGLLAVSPTNL